MSNSADHFISICETCKGTQWAGHVRDLIADRLPVGFAVRTVSCMAGCAHPTTVGFQAANKTQYLFGDIHSTKDVDALVAFAHQYHSIPNGWCNATERPPALLDKTLARLPCFETEAGS